MNTVLLRYKLKKRQIKMLKRFAQMMKWPNLAATLDNMKRKDSEMALDDVSSDAFSFFSGVILPGVSVDHISRIAVRGLACQ